MEALLSMTRKSSWQKKVALALVVTLSAGSTGTIIPAAYAESIEAVLKATPYVDVAAGHWAEKHIAKLSLQGIVQGYGADGRFGVNDGVSHQDAVVMAVRFLGLEDEIDRSTSTVFPEDFGVSEYAKPYILYAMQHGLLNRDQEFALSENLGEGWGVRKASREWVTRLLIRTIAESALAEQLAAAPATFADRNQIDADYLGFVNAAVNLKLMNGVTADKFEPKTVVTRAMLATLFSRAQGQFEVDYPSQFRGIVSNLTDTAVTLFDAETQQSRTYALDNRSVFYRYDSESQASAAKLTLYAEALVLAEGSQARYVEGMSDDAHVETIKGEIARVVPAENKLWLSIGNDFVDVPYDSSVRVRSSNGESMNVADLVVGSQVEVQRDTFRSEPMIVAITVQGAPVNKTASGTVQAVGASSITVLSAGATEPETWEVASNALIALNDQVKQLSDVTVGNTITYEVVNSQVTSIRMTQTGGYTVTGELIESVRDNARTINYMVGSKLEANLLSPNVQVAIDGLSSPTLADLVQGDRVQLTINDQGSVTAIQVMNRQVEYLNGAQIVSYDKEKKVLTVLNDRGRAEAITLAAGTRITYNGTVYPQQAAEDLLTRNKKITIGYTDGTAVSIELVLNYTGRLTALNQTSNKLTLSLQNGSTITLDYQTMGVELYGRTTASISDVKIGDTVSALLGANQDQVVALQVHSIVQQEIVSVDQTAKKIKLKAADGSVADWFVTTNWQLKSANDQPIALANLSAGQLVNVTFVGKQPAGVKVVDVKAGKLTGIQNGSLTLTDYSGVVNDYALGSAVRVERNGTTSTSLSSLTIGEHVQIRKDAQDQFVIAVQSGMTRTFWRHDAAAGELQVMRNGIMDNNYRFAITADTKFIVDGAASSIEALKNGDQVKLFFANGKLVEVVK